MKTDSVWLEVLEITAEIQLTDLCAGLEEGVTEGKGLEAPRTLHTPWAPSHSGLGMGPLEIHKVDFFFFSDKTSW